jgi:cell wall-associated NlpC family hydrolase
MGIRLPRDAYLQAREPVCEPISMQELKAGDLIFFGQLMDKITHIGFYLGEGKFIHACVKPVPILQITELDDAELDQRFIFRRAGRVNISY